MVAAARRSLILVEAAVEARQPGCDEKLDQALDEALKETFPASDPVAVTAPGRCG